MHDGYANLTSAPNFRSRIETMRKGDPKLPHHGAPQDISQFIADLPPLDEMNGKLNGALEGMEPRGPFAISGTFADAICPFCGAAFNLDSAVPWPHVTVNGTDAGPLCQGCAAKHIDKF